MSCKNGKWNHATPMESPVREPVQDIPDRPRLVRSWNGGSMTFRTTGVEAHPDLVELRNRYELAAEKPAAQMVEGLSMLSGLYLALSPWILGFTRFPGSGDLRANNLITGLAVAVLAMC